MMFRSPPKITSNICELNFNSAEKLVAVKIKKQIVTEYSKFAFRFFRL
jgi:hypothetical protein